MPVTIVNAESNPQSSAPDAESQIRNLEAKFRKLMDFANDAIFIADAETGMIVDANRRAQELTGRTLAELRAMHQMQLHPPDEGEKSNILFRDVAVRGSGVVPDLHVIRQDGRITPTSISISVIDIDGRKLIQGIFRDVTEQRDAEETLRKERDFSNALVDVVGTLVVVLDREGCIVRFNSTCEQVTGYRFAEVQNKPLWDLFIVPEERAQVQKGFARLLDHVFPTQGVNYWQTRKGDKRLISWSNTSLVGRDGQVEYVIGTGIDITDRTQMEEEIRQAHQALDAIIQAAPVAIVAMDRESRVTIWNKGAENIFGWKADEVMGKPAPLMPDAKDDEMRGIFDMALRGETVTGIEVRRTRSDDREIDVALSTAPLRDASNHITGVIGVLTDETERNHLENQLSQIQKLDSVGRFAGGIAHDFNNLLTIINGYSELMINRLNANDPLHKNVQEIRQAGERASSLTRQLLTFSRRQVLQPKVIDLNTVVADMDKMLRRLIGEDIELRTVLSRSLGRVKVDPAQMEQTIMNLAVNARDAMPQGGTLIIETANVELDESYAAKHPNQHPGSYVMLAVSDTGIGMDSEIKAHIFEPFFTTKEEGRGTGLGLSIVYGIVKQSGGHIWVYSEKYKGTTFKIYLPRVDEMAETARATQAGLPMANPGETVLVVEDEDSVRALAAGILRMCNYEVLEARNGGEALMICERQGSPITLMLTDVIMPTISGPQLAARVLKVQPRMKVLFMSGYTDEAIIAHGVVDVKKAFVQKPFRPDALAQKVRETLDAAAKDEAAPKNQPKPFSSDRKI